MKTPKINNLKTRFLYLFQYLIMIGFFSSLAFICHSQINITMDLDPIQGSDVLQCYTVKLENPSPDPISLAGQNYRFYYNSKNVHFEASSLQSYLSNDYLPISVIQNIQNQSAQGFGNLEYESNLGFVNLATDFKLDGTPMLIPSMSDLSIVQLCFDKSLDDPYLPIQIDWASEKTNKYATAFNELAQYRNGKLKPIEILNYSVNTNALTRSLVLNSTNEEDVYLNATGYQVNNSDKNNRKLIELKHILNDGSSNSNYCIMISIPDKKQNIFDQVGFKKLDLLDGNIKWGYRFMDDFSKALVDGNRAKNMGALNVEIFQVVNKNNEATRLLSIKRN